MQSKSIQSHFTNFKKHSPLVHNITNDVANNTVANVLLASGASPAMVIAIEEAPDFVKISHALALNIGTLCSQSLESMLATAQSAHDNNIPWVLDPVAVGATSFRLFACKQLLKFKPDVIRGNASEILALAGMSSSSKGADSGDSVQSAKRAAASLLEHASVVIITGETDWVTDGKHCWSIENGDLMMTKVTAIGCALSALIAGIVASNTEHKGEAAAVALCFYGLAGELAAKTSNGPGSFYVEFLDALHNLDALQLARDSKVSASLFDT